MLGGSLQSKVRLSHHRRTSLVPATTDQKVKTLQQLIAQRRKDLGGDGRPLSYEKLAARAGTTIDEVGEPKARISTPTLHNYATLPLENIPPTDKLLALADALGVDPDEVLVAAGASVNIRLRTVEPGERARLALLGDRSDEEIAALMKAVEILTRSKG
jgi:hypothetical protein